MLARTDSRARALVLLICATLVAGGIAARLVWWQVIEQGRLGGMALQQLAQVQKIPAQRGEIRDANGDLLATSVQVQSVYVTPPTVKDPESSAALLASVLDMPIEVVRAKLTSHSPWVWIKRRIDDQMAQRVRALALPGVGMLAEPQRSYPVVGVAAGTTIAAQVLGYVDVNGAGRYGVEQSEDALLAGQPGLVDAQQDVTGRRIADSVAQLRPPVNGANLTLTIDAGVQHLLEATMLETFKRNRAEGVTGLVMNVKTGAIVAMASFPSFDANRYASTDPQRFSNPAVSRQYEPGSVMKAFTVSAALDAGAVSTTQTFVDNNNLQVGGVRIQNADRYWFPWGHGPITAAKVLQLSNNVGAAKIGLTLGGDRLYEAFRRFGFGSPTGIELAGEAAGQVWDPRSPNASGNLTTAQNSFGQGISVTAVQLAAGYAAIANGGTMVTPHVIAGWSMPDGSYHPNDLKAGERIMRQATARTVLGMLTDSVDKGIAKGGSLAGYSVAGKTGTAEIAGPVQVRGADGKLTTVYRYVPRWIDSSFIGVTPAGDPQLVTLILIHKPAVWGLYQMAERPEAVFRTFAPQMLDYLAIPPDRPTGPVASR
ncbi:MAG: peptidoglycan D,D-transpeptidase FtsI family protein [Candidatus Limnocylindria bacterium]